MTIALLLNAEAADMIATRRNIVLVADVDVRLILVVVIVRSFC